jgi:uncharacterized protein with HEPN domain
MSDKKRDAILFLEDLLNAIERIERYTANLTFEEFRDNEMAADAVVRNFEIIGEAAKNVPDRIMRKYPFVEWKEAIGFRNVLIHDYFGIDLEAVWDTIKNNIPSLKTNVLQVLESEGQWAMGDQNR